MLFRPVLCLTTRGQQRPRLTEYLPQFPGAVIRRSRDGCVESEGTGRSERGVSVLKVGREEICGRREMPVVILQGNRV